MPKKQHTPTNDALKALWKIEAATEVGVSYLQYRQLLIEAQSEVNEAKAKLPKGELKQKLSETMKYYVEAGQLGGSR